jgi:DNA-nicking Smr family endonuclease
LEAKYEIDALPRKKKPRKIVSQAKRAPEDTLDLHGFTVDEALKELKAFIMSSRLRGYYLIKIIHGKGLHSQGEAKLRALVEEYLNKSGKNLISTWKQAPPQQGGEGATLVFL